MAPLLVADDVGDVIWRVTGDVRNLTKALTRYARSHCIAVTGQGNAMPASGWRAA